MTDLIREKLDAISAKREQARQERIDKVRSMVARAPDLAQCLELMRRFSSKLEYLRVGEEEIGNPGPAPGLMESHEQAFRRPPHAGYDEVRARRMPEKPKGRRK